MTDATVGSSAVAGANAQISQGIAGAAITINQSVYLDTATGTWKLADGDNVATAGTAALDVGVAMNTAPSGGLLFVAREGTITMSGATFTRGVPYFISLTAGGLCPLADLGSGDYPVYMGLATSATAIWLHPHATGTVI